MKSKFLVGTGLIMIAAALCHRLSESKKFLHMISEIFFNPGELVREFHGGLCITVPAGYRRGSAPIALVFEMKKER